MTCTKRHEFEQQAILVDKSLTKDEKPEAIHQLNHIYDQYKLIYNTGFVKIINRNV